MEKSDVPVGIPMHGNNPVTAFSVLYTIIYGISGVALPLAITLFIITR